MCSSNELIYHVKKKKDSKWKIYNRKTKGSQERKSRQLQSGNRSTKLLSFSFFRELGSVCLCDRVVRHPELRKSLKWIVKMPLFNKKPSSKASSPTNGAPVVTQNGHEMHPMHQQQMIPSPIITSPPPPSLVFHCQLANGSPTGLITGFSSVKELYQKIAECYDFSVDEVI